MTSILTLSTYTVICKPPHQLMLLHVLKKAPHEVLRSRTVGVHEKRLLNNEARLLLCGETPAITDVGSQTNHCVIPKRVMEVTQLLFIIMTTHSALRPFLKAFFSVSSVHEVTYRIYMQYRYYTNTSYSLCVSPHAYCMPV